jgi:hypothetical protein
MLPRKTGKPIAFKCTEELRQQTEAIADSLGESLSDYVRRAVEQRNAQHKQNAYSDEMAKQQSRIIPDSTHNTATKPEAKMMVCDLCNKELHPLDAHTGYIDNKLSCTHIECWNKHFEKEIAAEKQKKPTIPELKEKVKQMEHFRPCPKGGK